VLERLERDPCVTYKSWTRCLSKLCSCVCVCVCACVCKQILIPFLRERCLTLERLEREASYSCWRTVVYSKGCTCRRGSTWQCALEPSCQPCEAKPFTEIDKASLGHPLTACRRATGHAAHTLKLKGIKMTHNELEHFQ